LWNAQLRYIQWHLEFITTLNFGHGKFLVINAMPFIKSLATFKSDKRDSGNVTTICQTYFHIIGFSYLSISKAQNLSNFNKTFSYLDFRI